MPRINEWTEERTNSDGLTTTTKIRTVLTDEQAAQEDALEAAKREAFVEANASALWDKSLPHPMVLFPGDTGIIPMPDDSVLTIGAEGEVYRDGRRLGATAFASRIVLIGKTIYMQDANVDVPLIKRWTGTGWSIVKEQLDPRMFDVGTTPTPPNVQ